MQSVSQWQSNKEDWSAKNADFVTNWLPWQRHVMDRYVIYQVNKPFYLSTNPEILVKIGPLASEKQVLESRPLKI